MKRFWPIQPILRAPDGVIRFAENRIVRKLLDVASKPHRDTTYDLNDIVYDFQQGVYTIEEMEQLDQIIGYSVDGYFDLSYVRSATKRKISQMENRLIESEGGLT